MYRAIVSLKFRFKKKVMKKVSSDTWFILFRPDMYKFNTKINGCLLFYFKQEIVYAIQ